MNWRTFHGCDSVIAFNPSLLLHSIRGIRGGMSTLSFRTLLVIVLQLREYFLNIITISHYKIILRLLVVLNYLQSFSAFTLKLFNEVYVRYGCKAHACFKS